MSIKVKSTISLATPGHMLMPYQEFTLEPVAGCENDGRTIIVDPRKQADPMLGLGGMWTDTDHYAYSRMSKEHQEEALTALFDPEKGAGWSFMRLPLGSTDWEVTTDY